MRVVFGVSDNIITSSKWCVIVDRSYYIFFENDKDLKEYINKHDSVEDHEIEIKAVTF